MSVGCLRLGICVIVKDRKTPSLIPNICGVVVRWNDCSCLHCSRKLPMERFVFVEHLVANSSNKGFSFAEKTAFLRDKEILLDWIWAIASCSYGCWQFSHHLNCFQNKISFTLGGGCALDNLWLHRSTFPQNDRLWLLRFIPSFLFGMDIKEQQTDLSQGHFHGAQRLRHDETIHRADR